MRKRFHKLIILIFCSLSILNKKYWEKFILRRKRFLCKGLGNFLPSEQPRNGQAKAQKKDRGGWFPRDGMKNRDDFKLTLRSACIMIGTRPAGTNAEKGICYYGRYGQLLSDSPSRFADRADGPHDPQIYFLRDPSGRADQRTLAFHPGTDGKLYPSSAVHPRILAKHHAAVYDFLLDDRKKANEICVILDCPGKNQKEMAEFFCYRISNGDFQKIHFSFDFDDAANTPRVTLTGDAAGVLRLVNGFMAEKGAD